MEKKLLFRFPNSLLLLTLDEAWMMKAKAFKCFDNSMWCRFFHVIIFGGWRYSFVQSRTWRTWRICPPGEGISGCSERLAEMSIELIHVLCEASKEKKKADVKKEQIKRCQSGSYIPPYCIYTSRRQGTAHTSWRWCWNGKFLFAIFNAGFPDTSALPSTALVSCACRSCINPVGRGYALPSCCLLHAIILGSAEGHTFAGYTKHHL